QIDEVDAFGRLDVEELDGAAGVKHRGDQAGLDGKIDAGGRVGGAAGDGYEARGHGVRINQVESAGAAAENLAGVAGDRVVQLLRFEFGDEGLANGDKAFELAGLALGVAELPDALQDGGGLLGEAAEAGEVVVVEGG